MQKAPDSLVKFILINEICDQVVTALVAVASDLKRVQHDVTNGGHELVPTLRKGLRSGWMCSVCRLTTSDPSYVRSQICRGKPLRPVHGDGHTAIQSGTVTWCSTCGSYDETKARALAEKCSGPPIKQPGGGGRWGQLQKLLRGRHPKTGLPLEPVKNAGVNDGRRGSGTYSSLDRASQETQLTEDGFRPYVLKPPAPARVRSGEPASVLMAKRLERIRARESRQLEETPNGARSAG